MRRRNIIRSWVQLNTLALASLILLSGLARSEDWPMWRHDASRSSATREQLPASLSLQWSRQLVESRMAWPEDPRIHFDTVSEPVYAGGLLFVPSATTDSVTAMDAATGTVRWKFYADGPVRFAPVVAHQQVYFGADDGFIYCLQAATGKLQWRQAARPSDRQAIGSERVISVWPIRGGPVLTDGKIYFTAGVWPFEGVLLYDFSVTPGQQQAPAFRSRTLTSLTPQGYLAASAGRLYLPCGRALVACFDLATGKNVPLSYSSSGKTDYHATALGDFIFHGDRIYHVADKRLLQTVVHRPVTGPAGVAGTLKNDLVGLNGSKPTFVETVDRKGKPQKIQVLPLSWRMKRTELAQVVGASSSDWKVHLQAGNRVYGHMGNHVFAIEPSGTDATAKVTWHVAIDSPARTMIAGDGRLIVISESNKLYCFAAGDAQAKNYPRQQKSPAKAASTGRWAELTNQIVTDNDDLQAYCLVPGIGSGQLIDQLLQRTDLHLLVIDPSAEKVAALRRRSDAAGYYGKRIVARVGNVGTSQLPAYFANVIASEDSWQNNVGTLYRSLRPYGGNANVAQDTAGYQQVGRIVEAGGLSKARLKRHQGITTITRFGALAGSANWTHEYGDAANSLTSSDELVKAPLGVQWFGGPAAAGELFYNRHYWAPSLEVIDGRMFLEGPEIFAAIDVYTGRILWKKKLAEGTVKVSNSVKFREASPGRRGNFFEKVKVGLNFVVANDYLYMSDGRTCDLINPVTGKHVKQFKLPSPDQRWGRMRVVNDLLVATIWEKKDGVDMPVAIAAFDRESGDPYWRHDAKVSCPLAAIGKDRVYYFDGALSQLYDDWKRKGLVPEASKYKMLKAVDLRSGKQLWEHDTSQIVTWVGFSEDTDVLVSSNKKGIEARSASSGKLLWQKTAEGKGFAGHPENLWDRVILWKDRIIDQRGPGLSYDLKTGKPIKQKHPITGEEISWQFTKTGHHCNYAIASPHLMTFRAATAGFLDMESGTTGRLEGFRSGCRNSLIPANGVLNAPNFAHGCSCSYNLFTSLALVHVPDAELWTYSAFAKRDVPVDRVGINLGAPGDRLAKSGTMWLDYPNVGGPSPDVAVQVFPRTLNYFRKHASQVQGDGLSWVAASGCEGLESLIVTTSKEKGERKYKVRLYFVEPEAIEKGQRVFDVMLQGKMVLEKFDIVSQSETTDTMVIREFDTVVTDGRLQINLKSHAGASLLSGIELIAD